MNNSNLTFLDGPMGVTEKIRKAMYNVCREYLYIGFLLYEVKMYEYYRELDYCDVYEYAAKELGFKRTSVKNFIAVFDTFCACDKYGKKMFLKDEYENFNYSQLCEMLSLSPKDRANISPNMSVRQIRGIKTELAGQTSDSVITLSSKTMTVNLTNATTNRLMSFSCNSGNTIDRIVEEALTQYLDRIAENIEQDAI